VAKQIKKTKKMIKDLITDLIHDRITLNQGLTRAKLIALKTKDSHFLNWINSELNGYDVENVPDYRVSQCGLKGTISDYNGLRVIPINANKLDQRLGGVIYTIRLTQDIDFLEGILDKEEGEIIFKMPPKLLEEMNKLVDTRLIDCGKEINVSQIRYVINQTKQKLIDTLIKLNEEFPNFENEFIVSKENIERVQNIVNNNIYGKTISSNVGIGENISQQIIQNDISELFDELKKLGIENSELLEELNEISSTTDNNKKIKNFTNWVSKMTNYALEKGISHQIPLIMDKINDFLF
jgi:hypothetical protein